jgi:hypothetical protein
MTLLFIALCITFVIYLAWLAVIITEYRLAQKRRRDQ